MAPGSQVGPPSILLLLLLLLLLQASALDPMEVRAGVSVVLPCSAPPQMDLEGLVLEWTREDLRDTYMFFFRDGRPYLNFQDRLFKDRVELQDPDMKNGNFSIVLHDAAMVHSGRYECHTFTGSQPRKEYSVYTDLKVLPDVERITVMPGEDVVFKMSLDFPVISFVWKRADDPEHYVFLYGMGDPHQQDPQYQGRIYFETPTQTQTQGLVHDESVVLHHVQPSDNGTYHGIILQSLRRQKRDLHDSEPHKVIVLEVLNVERITVMPGEDVVFKMSLDFPVMSFVWKRADDPEHYVFLYGMGDPHQQDPQYQGRIYFETPTQTQTQGLVHDESVVLRHVQASDSGTYHGIILQSLRRQKRDLHDSEPHKVIVLEVASGVRRFESGAGIVLFLSAALLTLG